MKLAKVIPIFKKNDKLEISNYHRISFLPVISKVMHTQLLEYFTENNLLSSQQYGFRPNRSTELATLELMDRNIHHMNENHCPVNIYLDFSNPFDSLIYDILLSKLKHNGIQENALQLLSSYLRYPTKLNNCNRVSPHLRLFSLFNFYKNLYILSK